jgi:hypothetical protein
VERKDLIVSSTYDTEKEELHVFVSAGTMEMDGERYEIKMMIL